MKLAIQLVTYESAEYLPKLFASLGEQRFSDWELFVLDNSSPEGRARVKEALSTSVFDQVVHVTFADKNLGFAGGHQALFEQHEAPYVLLVNPDLILTPEYIGRTLTELEANSGAASAMGAIYRIEEDAGEVVYTDQVDTIGLRLLSTGSVVDVHRAPPSEVTEIFGVPGCVAMYKRSALKAAPDGLRLFDEAYFVYKEDVELALRVRALGFKALLVPDARGYHKRTFRSSRKQRNVSRVLRYYSYRNHWWNLFTYYSVRRVLSDAWAIVPYELAKLVFTFIVDPTIILDAIRSTIKHGPYLQKKRHVYAK